MPRQPVCWLSNQIRRAPLSSLLRPPMVATRSIVLLRTLACFAAFLWVTLSRRIGAAPLAVSHHAASDRNERHSRSYYPGQTRANNVQVPGPGHPHDAETKTCDRTGELLARQSNTSKVPFQCFHRCFGIPIRGATLASSGSKPCVWWQGAIKGSSSGRRRESARDGRGRRIGDRSFMSRGGMSGDAQAAEDGPVTRGTGTEDALRRTAPPPWCRPVARPESCAALARLPVFAP
jgi:hypothetical protein